ncbi:MAG: ribonuclease P protein component 4 [Promethearchaeota archaeon]
MSPERGGARKRRWRGRKARRYRKRTNEMKVIAKERVEILFGLAERAFPTHPERAHRYVEIARRVAMSARVRIPRSLKRRVCHGCKRYLVPGANCRYRLQSGPGRASRVVLTCLECGHRTRYHIKLRGQTREGVGSVETN